jgi:hypothetical protein
MWQYRNHACSEALSTYIQWFLVAVGEHISSGKDSRQVGSLRIQLPFTAEECISLLFIS